MSNVDLSTQLMRDLNELVAGLDIKEAKQALRRTLRSEAQAVQNYARKLLRRDSVASTRRGYGRGHALKGPRPIQNAKDLAKNIIGREYKNLEGFSIRALPKGAKYMHANKRGEQVPAAFWLNSGTKRAKRGEIEARDYTGRAGSAMRSRVEERIGATFRKWVEKTIAKRGKQ